AVAEILKAVTRVPAQEEQSLLLRNIITKEHPHAGRKRYQKVKIVHEDTGSQGQKSKDQALRVTIYPNHGYVRKLIRLLHASAILISQRGPVYQVTSKHMTEVRTQKITSRSFKRQQMWNVGRCQHGATCSIPDSLDPLGSERRQDIFTLLSKYPKEILALEKGKFKAPPPMTTPIKKRSNIKFCEFHGEVGHNTDECMHLKRQIEELLKNGKLSYRVARQRITQRFSSDPEISFLPLEEEEGSEGPMIIEAKIGGHFIHRLYVDGKSAS
ncbi:hypothetical protein Tco_1196242, partial [Tanacetum coccineum]